MLWYNIILLPIVEEVTQCPLPLWCMWLVSWLLYSDNSLIVLHDWIFNNGLFCIANFLATSMILSSSISLLVIMSKSPLFKRQWSWVLPSHISSSLFNLTYWQDANPVKRLLSSSCNNCNRDDCNKVQTGNFTLYPYGKRFCSIQV